MITKETIAKLSPITFRIGYETIIPRSITNSKNTTIGGFFSIDRYYLWFTTISKKS